MRLADLPLLADENIDPDVVAALRRRGQTVQTVDEAGLGGATDREIIRVARRAGQVVITHDSDFGALAIRDGEPFFGVVHLRPGHISSRVVIGMLDAVCALNLDLEASFIIVADRRREEVRVRVRSVP